MAPCLWEGRDRAVESQVLEAYERLVSAFREGRWEDKFACFAPDATAVDGAECSSLDEYRWAWERWAAGQQDGSRFLSVETLVMKLHMLGDVAVLVHSIHMRQRTNEGEETAHERETRVREAARRSVAGGASAPISATELSHHDVRGLLFTLL